MAHKRMGEPPIRIPAGVVTNLADLRDLVAGETYLFQSTGLPRVSYCNHPTDPTGEDIDWLSVGEWEHFTIPNYSAADNPFWLTTDQDGAWALLTRR